VPLRQPSVCFSTHTKYTDISTCPRVLRVSYVINYYVSFMCFPRRIPRCAGRFSRAFVESVASLPGPSSSRMINWKYFGACMVHSHGSQCCDKMLIWGLVLLMGRMHPKVAWHSLKNFWGISNQEEFH